MAKAKIFHFSDDERRAACLALAMSHPARVRILEGLSSGITLSYSQIRKAIPLAEGTLSHHLSLLSRADLLEAGPLSDGSAGYRLNAVVYAEANRLFRWLLAA
ncbi:MAG: helix-turn-helix domain-containing protein [Bacteroidota bacterium]